MRKENVVLLITLILVLLILNYPYLDNSLETLLEENKQIRVDRVIDGDTIESNKSSIRLLGINSPERGEHYYKESKEFLEGEILNESVLLEFVGAKQDKYYRTLAYVHFNGENINAKIVENGLANYYFYSGKDKYSNELIEAWDSCLEKQVNLCEPSTHECAQCITLTEDSIINNCTFSCSTNEWIVEGEGRNQVILNTSLNSGEKANFELDLSHSSGSVFLRDFQGKLVDWKA